MRDPGLQRSATKLESFFGGSCLCQACVDQQNGMVRVAADRGPIDNEEGARVMSARLAATMYGWHLRSTPGSMS